MFKFIRNYTAILLATILIPGFVDAAMTINVQTGSSSTYSGTAVARLAPGAAVSRTGGRWVSLLSTLITPPAGLVIPPSRAGRAGAPGARSPAR